VEHSPAAVDQLLAQIAALEPDPAEVRVVIQTRHGLLVERLLDAELRAIARDDERAARDQRRLLNRLRHDLLSTYQPS
jgi:phage-related baseplate assembly protein